MNIRTISGVLVPTDSATASALARSSSSTRTLKSTDMLQLCSITGHFQPLFPDKTDSSTRTSRTRSRTPIPDIMADNSSDRPQNHGFLAAGRTKLLRWVVRLRFVRLTLSPPRWTKLVAPQTDKLRVIPDVGREGRPGRDIPFVTGSGYKPPGHVLPGDAQVLSQARRSTALRRQEGPQFKQPVFKPFNVRFPDSHLPRSSNDVHQRRL